MIFLVLPFFFCFGVLFVAEDVKPLCKVGVLLETLPEGEADALLGAFRDKGMSSAAIHRVLVSEGYRVGRTTVKAHRRGDCCCELG